MYVTQLNPYFKNNGKPSIWPKQWGHMITQRTALLCFLLISLRTHSTYVAWIASA